MNVFRHNLNGLCGLGLAGMMLLMSACSSGGGDTTPSAAPPASVTLTVAKAGGGTGMVTSTPAGINCGVTCTLTVSSGTAVTLTAAPAPNNTLADWGGVCPAGSATCAVTVNSNQTVTATFNTSSANLSVSVVFAGTGTGSVTCNGGPCNATYPWGTSVTVAGVPNGKSSFAGWGGGGCTGTADCTVLLWADTQLMATFNLLPVTAQLSVSKSGNGDGTITSSPAGINCGATCSSNYPGGTVVTLTATPTAGSTFAGWSGGGCAGIGTCDVRLDAAKSVTAAFNAIPPTVSFASTTSGTGTGTITCNGAACQPSYPSGTALTIVATPAATSLFSGWGGDCAATGAATTCNLTINANATVSAAFNLPTLSVVVAGAGTVTSNPVGIDCGATCTASFTKSTSITLTATGANFSGWSGGGCSGTSTCVVTLAQNTTITATFGVVPIASRYHFFRKEGAGLLVVDPAAPTAVPTVVTSTATVATEVSSAGTWNAATATFEQVQSSFEVYGHDGRLWRVNTSVSAGLPGGPTNQPVQVSSEIAANTLCNVLAVDDVTSVTNRLLFYELPGADGQCNLQADNVTKLVALSDNSAVAPLTLPSGVVLSLEGSPIRRFAASKIVYNLASGVATHVFLVDAAVGNSLRIMNLNTRAITTIQANVGNRIRVLCQDTSDRVFVLAGTNPNSTALYLYTVSTNSLVPLVTASAGSVLIAPENASDGTNIYVGNASPGTLYRIPLTATSAAQVTQLLNRGADSIKVLVPATNRIYGLFQISPGNDYMLSIPKSGGATRIDIPAVVTPVNQRLETLVLEYSRNGLLYYTQHRADRTNPSLNPPPITAPTLFILAENGTILSTQPSTSLTGWVFEPTIGVRGEALTLSKVPISGFDGTTYAGGTLRVLDAATGNPGISLGTVPATSPAITAFPVHLVFIDFLNGASLGIGVSTETQTNTVFFTDTDVPNSLVQVPIAADQWGYTLRQ